MDKIIPIIGSIFGLFGFFGFFFYFIYKIWEIDEKERKKQRLMDAISNLEYTVTNISSGKGSKRRTDYRISCLTLLESSVKYDERLNLLYSLFEIAYKSDGVDDTELELLQNIAKYLLIQNWDLVSLEYKFECKSNQQEKKRQAFDNKNIYQYKLENAYKMLELSSDCSDMQIKEQFRSLAKECHPDMLPSSISEKEKETSVEQFRNIKEAYEYLCEIRNIK